MWYSRKQHMICTSTAEAEIHAILEMVFMTGNAKAVVQEIFGRLFGEGLQRPIILNNNQPGLDAIRSRKGRNKHYDIKVKKIAEGAEKGLYLIKKV